MVLEGFWRGWTNISMLFVGGLCAFLVGKLNEHSTFYDRKMWQQCLIGTVITLFIEFISGLILNMWLSFNIWDYSNTWVNVYGQICLPYAFLWFILMPLCIYVDDWLRYKLFNEEKPLGVKENYINLFLGK
ncbi:hypothetical protein CLPUN_02110 [Clostridium puniceum]|uniref:ABC-transporter type IV n=2 Tax=Clostridium puniceum TaxID=29367 RepID=A0A1S8TY09_9CLOT|nr:hypothetical protein CLPUN_02110 [Clostridium puniceum]